VAAALRLVIEGKAEIVEADQNELVRSARLCFPSRRSLDWSALLRSPPLPAAKSPTHSSFARDDYRCQYCHRTQADLRHREC
jgi:hypothetical protein